MLSRQARCFAEGEGDQWFLRNKADLDRFRPEDDLPIKLMDLYGLRPRSVVEIGAANGYRLAVIAERYGSKVVGVEPSGAAVADGRSRFPKVEFVQASANALPVDLVAELVIVNFVLHWVDRAQLLASVAEVDRLAADGGFLILGDLLPFHQVRVPYHHLPTQDVYTYKQDYAALFLASGLYHLVALLTGDADGQRLDPRVDEDARMGTWLMRKMVTQHYIEGARRGTAGS